MNWQRSTYCESASCVEVWRTSSYSGGGNCVEVASAVGAVNVRDGKDRGGPVLTFGRPDWSAFLGLLRRG